MQKKERWKSFYILTGWGQRTWLQHQPTCERHPGPCTCCSLLVVDELGCHPSESAWTVPSANTRADTKSLREVTCVRP